MANQSISPVLNRCNSELSHNQLFTSPSCIMMHGAKPRHDQIPPVHPGVLDFIRFRITYDCR
jgi:hypothetical protein